MTVPEMKLLMLCDYPMSPSEIEGGVSAAAYNLVQALLENTSISITVLGFWSGFDRDQPEILEFDRLRVIRCPKPRPRGHLRNFRRERKLFAQFIGQESPDIIHAQSEGLYSSVAVHSGLPNVYTIHGIRLKELAMIRKEIGDISYFLQTRLIKDHHRRASHIIAINRYTEDAIRDHHRANVRIIHNAVDDAFFQLANDVPREPGRLLQVGGIRLRKDVLTCAKAVDELNSRGTPVQLDVVGPVNEDDALEVKRFIADNGLTETIRIRGLVSASELEDHYRKADIFVMSSIEESSPISIVQAMAAGLPIVSTDVGGIAEMVKQGENAWLVEAGNAGHLADRIESLIKDRNLRDRFALESRKIADSEWSPKAVAQKTYGYYEEIISEQ